MTPNHQTHTFTHHHHSLGTTTTATYIYICHHTTTPPKNWESPQCSNHCNLHKGTQFLSPSMPCRYCVPLCKLKWLLHCALHQRRCWSWAGRWWWWLELHVVAAFCSNLRWCWSWPLHFAPWPLHLVLAVVVTGSNFTVVVFLPRPLAQTPLAPAVVLPIATCACDVFPSIHWRRYLTYTRATCTLWWWMVKLQYILSK